jgi:hypothetical protein
MKDLNKKLTKKYAYVGSGGTIWKISTNGDDMCAVEITSANCPSVTVGDDKLYLDDYIEVGDVYITGQTPEFKKTIHKGKDEGGQETTIEYQTYFHDLCEQQIADTIIFYYTKDFDYFDKHKDIFYVPSWIFSDYTSGTVSGITQINFTSDEFNKMRKEKVKELIFDSAKNISNKYGYELTIPSKASDIKFNGDTNESTDAPSDNG